MSLKQPAVKALRTLRILAIAERIRFLVQVVTRFPRNRSFRAQHPHEPMPPAWLAYDAFSDVNHPKYWSDGKAKAAYVERVATEHLDAPRTVCEWGCGPGRTLRHLVRSEAFSHVIGTDYNHQSIEWCQLNVPGPEWMTNGLRPPIDLPDDAVDMVFGISVLTHLSEDLGLAWMRELRRLTRPGGLILLTLHGQWFRDEMLLPGEQRAFDSVGYVGRGGVREGSRAFTAFHSPAYVRATLAEGLDELMHATDADPAVSARQDVWLFRNLS